jgi:hypothetical protein
MGFEMDQLSPPTTDRPHRLTGARAKLAAGLGLGERRKTKRANGRACVRWFFSDAELAAVEAEERRRNSPQPVDPSRTIRLGRERSSHIVVARSLGLGEEVRAGKTRAFFISQAEALQIYETIRARRIEAAKRSRAKYLLNRREKCALEPPAETHFAPVRDARERAIESFREELAAGRERRDAWRYACGWTGYEGPMPMVEVEPVDRAALIAEAAQRRDGDHRESRRVMAPARARGAA